LGSEAYNKRSENYKHPVDQVLIYEYAFHGDQ